LVPLERPAMDNNEWLKKSQPAIASAPYLDGVDEKKKKGLGNLV